MINANLGAWSFSLPEGWEIQLSDEDKTYLEAPDRTRGIYIQAVAPIPDDASATELAAQLQDAHLKGYSELDESKWEVMAQRSEERNGYCTSVLDIVDRGAKYCIRFIVVCGHDEGLRLALHDYHCEDYAGASAFFDAIETTIVMDSSATSSP